MRLFGDALFDLMFNAAPSFWTGLAVSLLILWLFKPAHRTAAVALLLLPFAKVLWDLRIGIPAASFFWASEQGVRQQLGQFQIGLGLTRWGPGLHGQLTSLHGGQHSPQSAGDLALRALRFKVGSNAACVVGVVLLAVSLARATLRSFRLGAFRLAKVRWCERCSVLETRKVGWRQVQVYSSITYLGVPFAGGLWRPYVLLPAALVQQLTPCEYEAVIQHELAHIRNFDLALLVAVEYLHDLLWYVVGVKTLVLRLRALLEQRADAAAAASGVPRADIARALLAVSELTLNRSAPPLLAMCRDSATLRARLELLLAPMEPTRAQPRWLLLARAALITWLVLGTLQAAACGNQALH